jgi:hypothetical protein
MRLNPRVTAALFVCAAVARAADPALAEILARLERLEGENAKLRQEIQELRSRLDGPPPVEERVGVVEQRVEDQSQTKVESSQRVPVRLTGMLLFNAFSSGRNGVPPDFPTIATANRGPMMIRGTMRQTSIGIEVDSPYLIAGAQAHGRLIADFYGTLDDYNTPRIRTGFLDLQWPSTGLRVGIEKPIVAPRSPSSLAQQIYPALWGMGNLWLWQPQVRVEQKFTFGGNELRAQAGLLQTNDGRAVSVASGVTLQPRPAWEGRLAFARRFEGDRAIEFAPGFHYSRTLASGTSVPSQLITGDWRIAPSHQWELTGAFFTGRNAGPIGGLRQGIVIVEPGSVRSVATTGGWSQLMYRPFDRLRFHVMAGQQDDRDSDLVRGAVGRNFSWIVNSMLQVSPNVLVGLEAQQIRTSYLGLGTRVLNRYDLALAYLF